MTFGGSASAVVEMPKTLVTNYDVLTHDTSPKLF